MSRKLSDLHEPVRLMAEAFLEKCKEAGHDVILTQTLRTQDEQQTLYEQGRTRRGPIVTKARGYPPESNHCFGIAFDFAVLINGKITWDSRYYEKIGPIGEEVGLEWGGRWRFTDYPHFQWTGGLTLKELQAGKLPVPDP